MFTLFTSAVCIFSHTVKFFWLVEMTFGQVDASCSLAKWQVSFKTDFFCPL